MHFFWKMSIKMDRWPILTLTWLFLSWKLCWFNKAIKSEHHSFSLIFFSIPSLKLLLNLKFISMLKKCLVPWGTVWILSWFLLKSFRIASWWLPKCQNQSGKRRKLKKLHFYGTIVADSTWEDGQVLTVNLVRATKQVWA